MEEKGGGGGGESLWLQGASHSLPRLVALGLGLYVNFGGKRDHGELLGGETG